MFFNTMENNIYPFADDMLIKLWNWEKQWSCQQVFEGHTHYVMQIVINPKDNNTFASASLDRTLKVCKVVFFSSFFFIHLMTSPHKWLTCLGMATGIFYSEFHLRRTRKRRQLRRLLSRRRQTVFDIWR